MGFTDLALEALNKKRQPLLNAYFADSHPNATRRALEKVLRKDWGWDTESYADLIDSAKEQGIKPIALDKKISASTRDAWHKAGLCSEDSMVREKQWADTISSKLGNDENSRVIGLVGKAHVGINPEEPRYLTSLLSQAQTKPFVISLNATAYEATPNNFAEAARAAQLQYERFAVPVIQSGFRPADYVVNLPPSEFSATSSDPIFARFILKSSVLNN